MFCWKQSEDIQVQAGSTRRIDDMTHRHVIVSNMVRNAGLESRWANVDPKDLALAIELQTADSADSWPASIGAEMILLKISKVTLCMNEETPISEERMQRSKKSAMQGSSKREWEHRNINTTRSKWDRRNESSLRHSVRISNNWVPDAKLFRKKISSCSKDSGTKSSAIMNLWRGILKTSRISGNVWRCL